LKYSLEGGRLNPEKNGSNLKTFAPTRAARFFVTNAIKRLYSNFQEIFSAKRLRWVSKGT
jgi:hypothetical protein